MLTKALMKIRFFIIFLVLFLFSATLSVQNASAAVSVPDFPVCSAPTGTLKVQHNDGIHGVIGNSAEFKGKDTVYTVNENQVLQCLCTTDGQGIQTNWWKIPSLTDSEIQALKNSGWYYVPNGALWGLDNTPYMAINNIYTCVGGIGGIGGGDVLSLAATGNMSRWFYGLIGIGVMFVILGFLLRLRRAKNNR
jgi:hypothetical protein